MKKLICFVLALVMSVIQIYSTFIAEHPQNLFAVLTTLGFIVLISFAYILLFCYGQKCIDLAPRQTHKAAVYVRILFGVRMIFFGFPAAAYILYAWIHRKDAPFLHSRDFEDTNGTVILLFSVPGLLSVFLPALTVYAPLIVLFGSIPAAIFTENARVRRLTA